MRLAILSLALLSGLLFSLTPPAQAAKKSRAAKADSGEKEIPRQSWNLTAKGFGLVFKHRNEEIESTEPNRFFPASVAFAMGKIDNDGHFLMLRCSSSANDCVAQRDMLEERIIYVTLLDVLTTPKVTKDMLYNKRSWELSPLGYKYIEIMRKRYPDLITRLGRLVGTALAGRS